MPSEGGRAADRREGSRLVVVLPTFNEVANLGRVVGGIRTALPDADVLVVDDGSPDGTGALADRLSAADPHVRVLHRPERKGLGAAYVAGFEHALAAGYDLVGEMDADGSHRPQQLPLLLAAIDEGADVAIGSRWVPGGTVVNWPHHRRLLSVAGNRYTRSLLGVPVHDVTAGFRVFRADLLRRIDLATVESAGYVFQAEMVRLAVQAGARVREVPIDFLERTAGHSKMDLRVVTESLWRITRWGVAERIAHLQGRNAKMTR